MLLDQCKVHHPEPVCIHCVQSATKGTLYLIIGKIMSRKYKTKKGAPNFTSAGTIEILVQVQERINLRMLLVYHL